MIRLYSYIGNRKYIAVICSNLARVRACGPHSNKRMQQDEPTANISSHTTSDYVVAFIAENLFILGRQDSAMPSPKPSPSDALAPKQVE